MNQNPDTAKNALDIVSVVATIGSFLQLATPLFGLIGAIWTLMRIAEMVSGKTFAELIRRKKADDAKQE
jgi:uroporphyrinogen-III decarboxylase